MESGEFGDACLNDVERRFGLVGCRPGEEHVSAARLGAWSERAPGLTQVGSVGVLLDHALGETLYVGRPVDHWSLTTELAYDVLVPPPWDTTLLHVEATVGLREPDGGFARGDVRDDRGRVLAVATTWVRYVPAPPGAPPQGDERPGPAGAQQSLVELLGCSFRDLPDGVVVDMPSGSWTNSYGVLHGGMWAVLAELAAAETFDRGRSNLATTHVHVSYLRRAVPGPVSVRALRRHQGRTFGEVEVVGHDVAGTRCVTATVTGRSVG